MYRIILNIDSASSGKYYVNVTPELGGLLFYTGGEGDNCVCGSFWVRGLDGEKWYSMQLCLGYC